MNNKVKQVLVLLFVVSTLLIMIGSVSANTDNLNENLEASDTLNVDLSAVPEADSAADEDVSNQLTISNIDEQTNGSSQSDLGESASANVVSSNEDTTIDAKDSANNIIKADNDANGVLSDSYMVITNTVSNSVVNVGDEVNFKITVVNYGDSYQGLQDGDVYFVPMQIDYDSTQLEYLRYTPQSNPENYLPVRENYNNVQFAYNTYGDFRQWSNFEFTATFRVKATGTLKTVASVLFTGARSEAQVNAMNFSITNTVLNPVVNIGDYVNFEVLVKNNGPSFYTDGSFVGVNFYFNSDEFEYVGYTPNINPDGWDFRSYFLPPHEDGKNNGFTQYAFGFAELGGFHNGYCFRFTVTLKAKVHGTLGATAQITQLNGVSAWTPTTSMGPNFEITNTALNPVANIGDDVSFEVFGKNVGGTYTVDGGILGIGFEYNKTQLDYSSGSLTPNANPSNYDFGGNQNPSFTLYDKGFVVGYASQKFYYGDTFNFTVTFKVLEHGTFKTTAFIWQNWGVRSTAQVISSDTNFVMSETPSGLTMKVGDNVYFTYHVQNQGARYNGNYVGLDIYFDADKLEYLGFSEIPNLNFESLEYTSTHGSDNALGLADGWVLGADSSVGHLKLGYTSNNGFDAGSEFNFDVAFNALTDGKLQSGAVLGWDQSKYSTMVSAYTFAGDPSFKLTKTADNQFVNKGDYVAYEIFLENNGTLQYVDNEMIIYINDWYPEGLVYQGIDINTRINGKKPILEIDDTQNGHVQIKYDLIKNGLTEGWAPGSTLNITLHFQVVSDGILCNFVFSEWNTSDVSSVVSGEPEINLTKKCLNSTVEKGDLVYYEIYLENTGEITYYDHSQGGTDYLIIEDLYPDGLEYVGYIPNPDKKGQLWPDNYEYVGRDGDNRVIIKYKIWNQRWAPGDSLNVTLIFRATHIGKLTNKAKFYWLWDDTITGSGNDINLTDETDVVVGPPAFSLEKISNYQEAKVGDIVSFSIIYSNTGNRTITGAYITDNVYSQGLEYYDFSDKELWTFDGKDTWYYKNKLEPGESVTLTLLFKALSVGKKSNTARAGHNMNNDTLEDTDAVLIKEGVNGTASAEGSGVSPDEPIDDVDEPDEPNKDVKDEPKGESDTYKESVAAESTMHEAGNPLFVLLLSLLTLCFVQRKGKE